MLDVSDPIAWLIPCFLLLAFVEFLLTRRGLQAGFCKRDVRASLILGAGCALSNALFTGTLISLGTWLGRDGVLSGLHPPLLWPLAFLLVDLAYYWSHRAGHRIRLFWATHSVHHSSRYFNLTVGLRNGWTGPLYPMAMMKVLLLGLGLPVPMLLTALTVLLAHQFLIHTESIGRLPRVVEAIFNTPSHHRVHHGVNGRYVDRNFGGILIIWDHLFGTFAVEEAADPPRYGLVGGPASDKWWMILASPWKEMAREVAAAPAPLSAIATIFSPPVGRAGSR